MISLECPFEWCLICCSQLIPARVDSFGHVLSAEVDEWDGRRGVALALRALAPLLAPAAVPQAVKFFVSRGLPDRAEPVRAEMLNAAMAVVEIHGKVRYSFIQRIFNKQSNCHCTFTFSKKRKVTFSQRMKLIHSLEH